MHMPIKFQIKYRPLGMSIRRASLLLGASLLGAPDAFAQNTQREEQGGAYLSVSGGLAKSVGQSNIAGRLSAGTTSIPFTGTANYKSGWNGRIALGYEDHVDAEQDADSADRSAPRYRAELEAVLLRMTRSDYNAGLLQVKPGDRLSTQALFANGYVRLIGKGTARLWAGAGLGYARLSLPDARQIAACACLGPAKGKGLAYQGKLTAEIRLSPRLQLVTEGAFVNLPGLRTAERPSPVATYAKTQVITTNAGLRLSF